MPEELGFWLAVGLVSIVSVITFKALAGRFGADIPGLRELAAFI